jgi:hypothetical protein
MLLNAIEAMYPGMRFIHVFLDNARYHHGKTDPAVAGADELPDQTPLHRGLLPTPQSDRTIVGVDAPTHHPHQMLVLKSLNAASAMLNFLRGLLSGTQRKGAAGDPPGDLLDGLKTCPMVRLGAMPSLSPGGLQHHSALADRDPRFGVGCDGQGARRRTRELAQLL